MPQREIRSAFSYSKRARSSIRFARWLVWICLLPACATPGAEPSGDLVDVSTSFFGWRGEVAVFRTESIDGTGATLATFTGLQAAAAAVELDMEDAVLPLGSYLVRDGARVQDAPLTLRLDLSLLAADRERIDNAIQNWPHPVQVPSVPATITVSTHETGALWQMKTVVRPMIGETTLEWHAPVIQNAWLSPSGRTVAIELDGVLDFPSLVLAVHGARDLPKQ